MAMCSFEDCNQIPEYILWEQNYKTYCENHKSTNQENVYRLECISADYYLMELINWKYIYISTKILEIQKDSISFLKSKEKNNEYLINLVSKLKKDYIYLLKYLIRSTPSDSKLLIDATLYNLFYLERVLPVSLLTDIEIINNEINKFQFYSEEIIDYRSKIINSNQKQQIHLRKSIKNFNESLKSSIIPNYKILEIVYFDYQKEYRLYFCKILNYREKKLYKKKLVYFDESYKNILKNEIQIISANENSGIFVPIIPKSNNLNMNSYKKEIFEPTLASLLKSKKFKENEIWEFVELIKKFLNCCSDKILNYILEPGCISIYKGKFIIQDIYRNSSNSILKYKSPEQKNNKPNINSSSSAIYSAGLIILEMLDFDIEGFNSKLLYRILLKKINNLTISKTLKDLLSQMLNFNANKRLTLENLNNFEPPIN